MLNISICDDDKTSVDKLSQLVKEYCQQSNMDYTLSAYTTGSDLLSGDIDNCHLLFLDVDMGEENGIAIAHEIR